MIAANVHVVPPLACVTITQIECHLFICIWTSSADVLLFPKHFLSNWKESAAVSSVVSSSDSDVFFVPEENTSLSRKYSIICASSSSSTSHWWRVTCFPFFSSVSSEKPHHLANVFFSFLFNFIFCREVRFVCVASSTGFCFAFYMINHRCRSVVSPKSKRICRLLWLAFCSATAPTGYTTYFYQRHCFRGSLFPTFSCKNFVANENILGSMCAWVRARAQVTSLLWNSLHFLP